MYVPINYNIMLNNFYIQVDTTISENKFNWEKLQIIKILASSWVFYVNVNNIVSSNT